MRKDILALFTATAAILCSCSSKQYREQGSEKGKEFATGLSEPQSITASETAAGEKVAETETLSNQSTVNKKKIIKDGKMCVKPHVIKARNTDIAVCLKLF